VIERKDSHVGDESSGKRKDRQKEESSEIEMRKRPPEVPGCDAYERGTARQKKEKYR
jgi:hypothetical protein